MKTKFNNSQEAFEYYYDHILEFGTKQNNTLKIKNVGFTINNPTDNHIKTPWRKWNPSYAEFEWEWYLSEDRTIDKIAKRAPIWYHMANDEGLVNSNYGYQWNRNNQLQNVIRLLKQEPNTRQASISIYDGKEIYLYEKDTPCTYAINFDIDEDRLNMSVLMRSNDLVLGFCNDQYCFSKLQQLVANELILPVGTYYHWSANLHIYDNHFKLKDN